MHGTIAGMAAALTLALSAAGGIAAPYTLDYAHSSVGFSVKHMAIARVNGTFGSYTASFDYTPDKPETWSVQASIDVASISTANEKRDEHLRSADFFAAAEHPKMTFKSTSVRKIEGDRYALAGDLTIRETTLPVTLDLVFNGAITDPWGNERAGFTATGRINRKAFGLAWNNVLETGALVVGDEVDITIQAEGIKAK